MALAKDILDLRYRALAELVTAHDYYTDTKRAWRIVHKVIQGGRRFTIRNLVTKSITTEAELASKARGYVAGQLAEATFQQFISIFENWFFELLRLWLTAYPQSLGGKELPFRAVLEAPDKESITMEVVNKELNEIAYKRPKDWFIYLGARVNLNCPSEDEIDRIAEAKASRDVLAHSRGIANRVYKSKAGKLARFEEGEKLIIPESYHRTTWEMIRKVIGDVTTAAATKAA